jgi:rhodanese-related sulfurtransferase
MIRELRPSLFARVLTASCLLLLAGCGASDKNADDTIADAAVHPSADGNERSLVSDGPASKDVQAPLNKDAPLAKDTGSAVTPGPDATQPRADLAIPDTSAGQEAAPLPTDTMVTADGAANPVDTTARGDATVRVDALGPDSTVKATDAELLACQIVEPTPPLGNLTPQQLKEILDSGEDAYLINVKGTSIANIPGTDAVLANDVAGIEALVGKKLCANIIIYCRTGATSQSVGNQLVAKGYQKVRHLSGGITAWTAAGYATE